MRFTVKLLRGWIFLKAPGFFQHFSFYYYARVRISVVPPMGGSASQFNKVPRWCLKGPPISNRFQIFKPVKPYSNFVASLRRRGPTTSNWPGRRGSFYSLLQQCHSTNRRGSFYSYNNVTALIVPRAQNTNFLS